MTKADRIQLGLLVGTLAVVCWSGWRPYDRLTWWLEVTPGLVGMVLLLATRRRFAFTTFCYAFIALHVVVLCVGGHYTYARVPLFDWLRPIFGWHRNEYDRDWHFLQGFVPALIARELFVRLDILRRKRWMPFLIVSVCLAISAFYELIEWWAAVASGSAANDFIGSQGDVWDTQADMAMALIGCLCALVLFFKWQDRALAKLAADHHAR